MKRYEHLLCHIPNLLSNFRIVLIPFFIYEMLKGNTMNGAIVLIASGITDMLDGYLARRFNWISDIGKALDPMADKLTTIAVCFCLMVRYSRLWFFFAIMLIKDTVMLVLGIRLHTSGVKIMGARWYGKVATIVFYVVMVLLILFPGLPQNVVSGLVIAAAGCAVMAALLYLKTALTDSLTEKKQDCPQEA